MQYLNSIRRRLIVGMSAMGLGLLIAAGPASAVDIAGYKIDETARVGGQELKLNGAGIRYKAFFKVYVGALYLPDKKTSVQDIQSSQGAKRVQITVLRDINSEDFGQAFMNGIRKNSDKTELAKYIGQMLQFGQLFASVPEIKRGDVLTVDWVPAVQGMVLQLNGKEMTKPLSDPGFYNAVLRIWLGPSPADDRLKRAMLGEKPDEGGSRTQ